MKLKALIAFTVLAGSISQGSENFSDSPFTIVSAGGGSYLQFQPQSVVKSTLEVDSGWENSAAFKTLCDRASSHESSKKILAYSEFKLKLLILPVAKSNLLGSVSALNIDPAQIRNFPSRHQVTGVSLQFASDSYTLSNDPSQEAKAETWLKTMVPAKTLITEQSRFVLEGKEMGFFLCDLSLGKVTVRVDSETVVETPNIGTRQAVDRVELRKVFDRVKNPTEFSSVRDRLIVSTLRISNELDESPLKTSPLSVRSNRAKAIAGLVDTNTGLKRELGDSGIDEVAQAFDRQYSVWTTIKSTVNSVSSEGGLK